jgi:glycosyltransferase involved in cell wall biosynthesis
MPRFSAIIPTYNRQDLLARTLESIWTQTFTDLEVLVVDDGSTDGTGDYLASLGNKVHVFTQSNRGPGAARNLGARHAQGQYLAFLDSDDLWFAWTLAVYAEALDQTGQPAFLAGKPICFVDETELISLCSESLRLHVFPDYLASGDEWRWWGVSSFVIRRDAFCAVGGFTDAWANGEDADLALRLGTAGGFVQICTPYTFAYREHACSAMGDFRRTVAGGLFKVRTEKQGGYPGGRRRARERQRILSRHLRPIAVACVREGLHREAWQVYRDTFQWHWALRRWKFLLGFPVWALVGAKGRSQASPTVRSAPYPEVQQSC